MKKVINTILYKILNRVLGFRKRVSEALDRASRRLRMNEMPESGPMLRACKERRSSGAAYQNGQ